MAVCARGSVLVFYVVFAGFFQLFGKIKRKRRGWSPTNFFYMALRLRCSRPATLNYLNSLQPHHSYLHFCDGQCDYLCHFVADASYYIRQGAYPMCSSNIVKRWRSIANFHIICLISVTWNTVNVYMQVPWERFFLCVSSLKMIRWPRLCSRSVPDFSYYESLWNIKIWIVSHLNTSRSTCMILLWYILYLYMRNIKFIWYRG